MAVKIIDLQAENAPSDDDLLIIRDNASGITKKITRANLFISPPIPAGAITNVMLGDGSVSKRTLGVDAKIGVRTYTVASPGTLTPDVNNYDVFNMTGLSSGLTIAAPTGTPLNRQGIMFSFRDNGTAQGIGWDGVYRSMGITIPGATVASRMLYISGRWNAEAQKWDLLSVARE